MAIQFITDARHYELVLQRVAYAKKFVWLATADLKDLHVHRGRRMVPFLLVMADLAARGVALRLLHAGEPGPAFQKDFDKYPALLEGLERMHCPRVHFKCVVLDGTFAYSGSANLTGAGMGAKSPNRRNFEAGFTTDEPAIVASIMEQYDAVWAGSHCAKCGRKKYCAQELF